MTVLIATNDFHSSLPSGVATLAAILELRQRGATVIDAGDFFGGTAFHEFSDGEIELQLWKDLYDFVTPGNHDLGILARFSTDPDLPTILCANLQPRSGFAGRWTGGVFLPGNPAVGLVGFIGRQAFMAADSEERAAFVFRDPSPHLLRAECHRLREQGANYVIGVSHSGFRSDVELQNSENLFDIVLSGHCHSADYVWASTYTDSHVVKAPEIGRGYLRLDISEEKGLSIVITRSPHRSDIRLPGGVEEAVNNFSVWAAQPICRLDRDYRDRHSLASALAEAMSAELGGATTLVNVGGVRRGLTQYVTRGDLVDALPFNSPIVRCQVAAQSPNWEEVARSRGEELVIAGSGDGLFGTAVYTTRYLADALDLPNEPAHAGFTLRAVVTDILARRHRAYDH
ncbi:metallophosphoesterase [Nocardia gipuzkoensis]